MARLHCLFDMPDLLGDRPTALSLSRDDDLNGGFGRFGSELIVIIIGVCICRLIELCPLSGQNGVRSSVELGTGLFDYIYLIISFIRCDRPQAARDSGPAICMVILMGFDA